MIRIDNTLSAVDNILRLVNALIKKDYPDYPDITSVQVSMGNPEILNFPTHNTKVLISPSEDESKISRAINLEYNRLNFKDILNHTDMDNIKLPIRDEEYSNDEIIDIIAESLKLIKDQCQFVFNSDQSVLTISGLPNSLLYIGQVELPILKA